MAYMPLFDRDPDGPVFRITEESRPPTLRPAPRDAHSIMAGRPRERRQIDRFSRAEVVAFGAAGTVVLMVVAYLLISVAGAYLLHPGHYVPVSGNCRSAGLCTQGHRGGAIHSHQQWACDRHGYETVDTCGHDSCVVQARTP